MNNDSVAVAERQAQSNQVDQALATWRARCDDVVTAARARETALANFAAAEGRVSHAQSDYDFALSKRRKAEEAYVATLRQDEAAA
jgi:multidrug efflux pump subunit AcrA (membrane-fusion protein)